MTFRYARHSSKIESLVYFYTSILEFSVLGEFKNHEGYDGVFLGIEGENWYLEFTQNEDLPVSIFDEDDVLVFYPENIDQYNKILENVKNFDVPLLQPKNPYWIDKGICFEDCEHYKIVVSKEKIVE